jgi:hypothetical protein
MKTEQEIRKFIKALEALKNRPCGDGSTPGEFCLICLAKRQNLQHTISVLEWVVGENYNGDEYAEAVMKAAAELAAEGE